MNDYRHSTGTFIGRGAVEIFFQSWTVPNPRTIIVITHGMGEHSGRYGHIIQKFKGKNVSFYALDLRGHGKSAGKRAYVNSFMDYIYDLKILVDFIRHENNHTPLVLLGHSLGGVIVLKYCLTYPEDFSAIILSSPLVKLGVKVPGWKEALARYASRFIPRLSLHSGVFPEHLTHDSRVIDAVENDPLYFTSCTARLYIELQTATREISSRANEITAPSLIIHGGDDRISAPAGSREIFEEIGSKNKELHIFQDLLHETMNETVKDREKVLEFIELWMMKLKEKKTGGRKTAEPAKKKINPKKKIR
jgi:alpha-beta hydrolase superfamily lysophospholipase